MEFNHLERDLKFWFVDVVPVKKEEKKGKGWGMLEKGVDKGMLITAAKGRGQRGFMKCGHLKHRWNFYSLVIINSPILTPNNIKYKERHTAYNTK